MDRDISFVSHGEDARTSSKRCLDSAQNDKALDMTEKLFPALDVYHDTMPHSAAMNMAIDEALLECAKIPSIRFYRWDHAALSFGYFGRFAEVANYAARRDLVRRWTGGGIVLHEDDLTYSIVITANHPVFAKSSMSIYAAVHKAIRDALAANGQRAELATVAALYERQNETDSAVADRRYSTLREGNTGACFSNPVQSLTGREQVDAFVIHNGGRASGYFIKAASSMSILETVWPSDSRKNWRDNGSSGNWMRRF